ncbi:hypothetical protein B0F90DRAFT_1702629 [Multifurca ochricompacta]|uniref:Uncharacterized protein n=1 Tax=Multifurca ochricompacta TaxID=376703 RepID=A0AAD4M831_9AGAM|nr:hypothetical protein B0F90DRAFT_1702629 [Multifurca ochricompacta]
MNCDQRPQAFLPIACRFVSSDQWLTTHFDATWKISEVKQYILAKVYNKGTINNDSSPSRTRNRPVSPITFASAFDSRNSIDSTTDGSLEDDPAEDPDPNSFVEPARQVRGRQAPTYRVASPSVPGSPVEQHPVTLPTYQYSMLAFSTGQLLEDDYSLAWYRLRPYELLELHPPGAIVRLQREVMLDYIRPYLELDVRALRVVISDKEGHANGSAHGPDASPNKIRKPKDPSGESRNPSGPSSGSSAPQSIRKRRKMKLEWRDRYLVIRQGILSLFKSRFDLTLVHTCSLSSLTTLRGQEDVVHTASAAIPSPHAYTPQSVTEPLPSSSPISEHWNDPWSGGTIPREDGVIWGRRGSKEDFKQHRWSTVEGADRSRGSSIPKEDQPEDKTSEQLRNENLWHNVNVSDGTKGIWLVLDTLDEFAHSNLLRVLHRCSPDTVSSTLVPSYLPLDSSLSSSPSPPSSPSSHSTSLGRSPCPYPEWRIEVSQRAQKSGLGDISDAMSWILWKGPPLEPPATKSRGGKDPRKRRSRLATDNSDTLFDPLYFDVGKEGEDSDCELEWESWVKDLARQSRASTNKHTPPTIIEPELAHLDDGRERSGDTTSSLTVSNVSTSEQVTPLSPAVRRTTGLFPGANMDVLSVDSPALLTAPSVLPFQSTGVTTSTVSVGGVVRTRSLISVDGGRWRGVPRAIEIPNEGGSNVRSPGKYRRGKQKRTWEENAWGTKSPTMTMRNTDVLSTTQSFVSPVLEVPSRAVVASASASGDAFEPASISSSSPVGVTTATTATTTTTTKTAIQFLPRRLSAATETLRPDGVSTSGDKAGKGKRLKSPSRGRTFSPERLVDKLDSALDFMTG